MKKIIPLLLITLFLASCSEDDDYDIVGTWELTSQYMIKELDGEEKAEDEANQRGKIMTELKKYNLKYVFSADGTVVYTKDKNTTISGRYTISGNVIKIFNDDYEESIEYSLKKNTLILHINETSYYKPLFPDKRLVKVTVSRWYNRI